MKSRQICTRGHSRPLALCAVETVTSAADSKVAARLHASDPERYPERVWADWLCGEHETGHRRAVLSDFGRRAGRAVLSNCRVLGEGVDIRAVDSVALLDPKGSAVDIVQASIRTGIQGRWGGRWTGNATTPASPHSSQAVPTSRRSCPG
ncbi:helicase-related protein [Streptomyces sp. 061-3]|uniref:helicase-related protein n=1 Tax=Streptomyces sp. 061-3 TaxID=2789268 RepID=UPI00397F4D8C